KLIEYKAKNIVLDPVMISTSGSKLLNDDAIFALKKNLFNLASIITPNIPEAQALSNIKINCKNDMINAAKIIAEQTKNAILIKGGHLKETADDLLFVNGEIYWYELERILNDNTHGTGCTLSSAIACNLAKGFSINQSVKNAKEYITGALKSNLNIGKGNGPINHCFNM
ncbi:MAG: bifunctional hydroxymethylpyrimidine kinase/phosphomethylpyrimidine kinase, partial [Oscillospiraceae bacterium]